MGKKKEKNVEPKSESTEKTFEEIVADGYESLTRDICPMAVGESWIGKLIKIEELDGSPVITLDVRGQNKSMFAPTTIENAINKTYIGHTLAIRYHGLIELKGKRTMHKFDIFLKVDTKIDPPIPNTDETLESIKSRRSADMSAGKKKKKSVKRGKK